MTKLEVYLSLKKVKGKKEHKNKCQQNLFLLCKAIFIYFRSMKQAQREEK